MALLHDMTLDQVIEAFVKQRAYLETQREKQASTGRPMAIQAEADLLAMYARQRDKCISDSPLTHLLESRATAVREQNQGKADNYTEAIHSRLERILMENDEADYYKMGEDLNEWIIFADEGGNVEADRLSLAKARERLGQLQKRHDDDDVIRRR